ncbi:unnamed protein product [Ectocarpus sp. 12 AP-2014]
MKFYSAAPTSDVPNDEVCASFFHCSANPLRPSISNLPVLRAANNSAMRKLLKRQASRGPTSGVDPASPFSTDSEDNQREPRGRSRDRMASDSTDGEVRSTLYAAHGQRIRTRDERGRTSPSLLQLARKRSTQKVPGTRDARSGRNSPTNIRGEVEPQAETSAAAVGGGRSVKSWETPHNVGRGMGSGDDGDHGALFPRGSGGYGTAEAQFDEEEPLLREEVADYVGSIDFRDGTGPSALPPNEVVRAFRDADEIALLGRGGEFWSRLIGDGRSRDQRHHSVGRGDGRAGSRWVGRESRGGGANGRRRRVVHVESATTGKFFKVYEGLGGSRGGGEAWSTSVRHPGGGDGTGEDGLEKEGREGRGAGSGGGDAGGFAEDEVRAAERLGIPVREVSLMRLNKGVEAGTLLVQGVLAGLTLASAYAMLLAESLESFVAAYEAQAGEIRRAMFFLCTLALMGTEDQLMQAKGKGEVWARLGWWGRLDLQGCVLLYGGCLVSSLVCAVADTGIANAYGSSAEGWYVSEMEDGLRSTVLLWYACNLARLLLAWIGWFLVCRRRWRASLLSDQSQIELKGQRDKLSAAEEQISRLNGRNLDPLTKNELQELRGSLKRALDNAERMIGLR